MRNKLFTLFAALIAASMILAACGQATPTAAPAAPAATNTKAPEPTKAPEATATPAPTPTEVILPIVLPVIPQPDEVTGDIITAGSSTVFPLSERMAELFQQEGYTGNITVDSIGTGAGFERFC
ncbi:MAG: hypothetical protein N2117_14870, partial [Anaerolineales bacterium]|nr:hypothetical protein [Anaerolineales bacterium]